MPGQDKGVAYNFLYWGTFIFAIANGTLEAVANPLVATLFPNKRTHYLNILHASWPAGLVAGGAIGWLLGDHFGWHWKWQLGLFLVPTVIYGLMFYGQHMPLSEASQKGLTLGKMFKDVGLLGALVVCFLLALFFHGALGIPQTWGYALAGVLLIAVGVLTNFSRGAFLLFVLFVAHLLVGVVELGTDGWIQNITGNILTPTEGKILFVFTSSIMFALRFTADFIQKAHRSLAHRYSVGLLIARRRRAATHEPPRDVHGRDARTPDLCRRKDILLADDARCRQRPVFRRRARLPSASWAASG